MALRCRLIVVAAALLSVSSKPLRFGEHFPATGGIAEYDGWEAITPESFYRNHVKKSEPAIFRGAAKDWEIAKRWTDQYLSVAYGNLTVLVEDKKDSRSLAPHDRTIAEFVALYRRDGAEARELNIIQDGSTQWMADPGSQPTRSDSISGSLANSSLFLVSQTPDAMLREVPLFPLLRCGIFTGSGPAASGGRGRGLLVESNLWLSSGATASTWHEDDDANVNCLLEGTKHWFLVAPQHRAGVGMCDRGLSSAYSPVDVDDVATSDSSKALPNMTVPYRAVLARAGDCVFLPGRYPHHVRSYPGRNLALTTLFDVPQDWPGAGASHDCAWDGADATWQAVLRSRNLSLADAGLRWGYDGSGADGISMGLEDAGRVFSSLQAAAEGAGAEATVTSDAAGAPTLQPVLNEPAVAGALREHLSEHLAAWDEASAVIDEPKLGASARRVFRLVAAAAARAAGVPGRVEAEWLAAGVPASLVAAGAGCGCAEAAEVVKRVEACLQWHAALQSAGPGVSTDGDDDEDESDDEQGWEEEEDELEAQEDDEAAEVREEPKTQDEVTQEQGQDEEEQEEGDDEEEQEQGQDEQEQEEGNDEEEQEEDEDQEEQEEDEADEEEANALKGAAPRGEGRADEAAWDENKARAAVRAAAEQEEEEEEDDADDNEEGDPSFEANGRAEGGGVPAGHGLPLGSHRPPEGSIAEVRDGASVTGAQLWREFLQHRRPVMLRGAAMAWPAMQKWSDAYLASSHGHLQVRLEEKKERETEAGRVRGDVGLARSTLRGFLAEYERRDFNGYVVSQLPDPLRRDLPVPRFLACPAYRRRMMEFNLWISAGDTRSIIHRDPNNFANCLLAGAKNWTFIQPRYQHLVPMEPEARYESGGASPIDTRAVDLKAFPTFAQVRYERVLQLPGDCIVSPGAYLHQVDSPQGRNVAVAFLFARLESLGSPGDVEALISECEGEQALPAPANRVRVAVNATTGAVHLLRSETASLGNTPLAPPQQAPPVAGSLWGALPDPPGGDTLDSPSRLLALSAAVRALHRPSGSARLLPAVPSDAQVTWPFPGLGGLSLGTLDPRGLGMALARVAQADCPASAPAAPLAAGPWRVTADGRTVPAERFWTSPPHPRCGWNSSARAAPPLPQASDAVAVWCSSAPWLARRSLRPDASPLAPLASPQCVVDASAAALGGARPPPPALLWAGLALGHSVATNTLRSVPAGAARALAAMTRAVDAWTANFTAAQVAAASGPRSHEAAAALWPDIGFAAPDISQADSAAAIAASRAVLEGSLQTLGDAVTALVSMPTAYKRALGASVSVDPSNTRFAEMAAIHHGALSALIASAAREARRGAGSKAGWVSAKRFASVYARVLGGTVAVGRQIAAVLDGDCRNAPHFEESCTSLVDAGDRLRLASTAEQRRGDSQLSVAELTSTARIQQVLAPFLRWQGLKEFDHGRESSVTLRYLQGLVGTGPETDGQ